jgi:uncharacterized protein (TIGR00251 family)
VIEVREREGSVSFLVRVQPRASCCEIDGEWQGALRIRLDAPPVDGRANDALRKFLAARLKVPVSAVKIAAGEQSRTKRIEIRGVTATQIRAMAAPAAHPGRHS